MLAILILVILAILVVSDGSATPVTIPGFRLAAALCGMASVVLMAWTIAYHARNQLRSDISQRHKVLRRYLWLRFCHMGALLGFFGVTMFGLKWHRVVQANWGLQGWVVVDELLMLAPFLVPLVMSWAAFYEVDVAVRQITGWLSGHEPVAWSRWSYLEQLIRQNLGMVLAPALLLIAGLDLLVLIVPDATQTHFFATFISLLAILAIFFPLLLRVLWKAKPLPQGTLRNKLMSMSRKMGLRARDILVWDTQGSVANAAVAGFVPQCRYILLSDGLLEHFSQVEIVAVFGHEAGHVKHRHLFLRLLSVVPLFGISAVLTGWLEGYLWMSWPTVPSDLQSMGLQLLITGGYLILVFGFFSRRLERQADIFGCWVGSCGQKDCPPHVEPPLDERGPERKPGTLCARSIEIYASMLNKLAEVNGLNRYAPSWQHFSIARRVKFLQTLLDDPAAEGKFQNSVRRLEWVLGLAIAVVCAITGWSWLR